MNKSQKILIVCDAPDEALGRTLTENQFETSWVGTPEAALSMLADAPCDLLIMDLADVDLAIGLLRRVRSNRATANTPVLTLAEWGTGQLTLAISQGANAFEPKPINAARLLAAAERLLRPRMAMSARANPTGAADDEF
jgi:DNA-binding response OmpR family regulator